MYVIIGDDRKFKTYKEARKEFVKSLDEYSIGLNINIELFDIIKQFLQAKTSQDFIKWFSGEIDTVIDSLAKQFIYKQDETIK